MRNAANNLVTGFLVVLATVVAISALRSPSTEALDPREDRFVESWERLVRAGHTVGPTDAPVHIVEFADIECPFCARFHETLEQTLETYDGRVAWTLIHYPLSRHPHAEAGAVAIECAAEQGVWREYLSEAFSRQAEFGSDPWLTFAGDLGLDTDTFSSCMLRGASEHPRIARGRAIGDSIGISGTPGVIVNGWLQGVVPHTTLDSIVEDELRRAR